MTATMLRAAIVALPWMSAFTAGGIADAGTPADAGNIALALEKQIVPCWAPPVPRETAAVVTVKVELNIDGQIIVAPTATAKPPASPSADAAIKAAIRALYTCAPYKLPPEQYATWRQITFTFDPRMMLPSK